MGEKTTRDKLDEAYLEKTKLRIEQEKSQVLIERNRYKQDCRKRALDLANSQMNAGVVNPSDSGVSGLTIELADKYYNWLISIPE